MSKKESNIRSFENLKDWRCARRLQRKIAKLVKTFPKEEKYRLIDQMIRSSRSIPRNIAEGYGRYHYQENIQFCRQSRGSLTKLKNDLTTAYEEQYIDEQKLNAFRNHIEKCNRLLNGYIAYLKRAKNEYQTREDETAYEVFTNNE